VSESEHQAHLHAPLSLMLADAAAAKDASERVNNTRVR